MHRTKGGLTASDTVGLVVEYAPATGETRVRFPDGVVQLQTERPLFAIAETIFDLSMQRIDSCALKFGVIRDILHHIMVL